MLEAAGTLPLSQTRSAWRHDVTIAIGIRFHNFILVMGVLQDSLLDGGSVVIETLSSAHLPQPPSPSFSADPRTTSTQQCLSLLFPSWAVSEQPQSQSWAMPYLSQLDGRAD